MSHAHFSVAWLRQREPFDTAARAAAAGRLHLPSRIASPAAGPARVIDLACGTGANFRVLAPQLGAGQQWLVVDHDAKLLAQWPAALRDWCAREGFRFARTGRSLQVRGPGFDALVVRQQADLVSGLQTLPFHAATLVTASALLDLVSEAWLQRLVALCAPSGASMLFALTVQGRPRWTPRDASDRLVAGLFEAHQARDKGFGPALGPAAGAAASRALRAAGCSVRQARSDWTLDGARDAVALHRALIDGIGVAAIEQRPGARATVQDWQARRHAMAGRAALCIAHVDLLATPARRSRSHSTSLPSA